MQVPVLRMQQVQHYSVCRSFWFSNTAVSGLTNIFWSHMIWHRKVEVVLQMPAIWLIMLRMFIHTLSIRIALLKWGYSIWDHFTEATKLKFWNQVTSTTCSSFMLCIGCICMLQVLMRCIKFINNKNLLHSHHSAVTRIEKTNFKQKELSYPAPGVWPVMVGCSWTHNYWEDFWNGHYLNFWAWSIILLNNYINCDSLIQCRYLKLFLKLIIGMLYSLCMSKVIRQVSSWNITILTWLSK